MSPPTNDLGQPIGETLGPWSPRRLPPRSTVEGRLCRVEPLRTDHHAEALHREFRADRTGANWTYLGYGPFESLAEFTAWVEWAEALEDTHFYAFIDLASGLPVGVGSFLRMQPEIGVIEVGHLNYSPAMQRTVTATEAMYLMMRRIFDELGYRRYEWKCDSLNAPSIAAAKRLGFRFEGTFRQATIYKGRNRDTAWLAIIDSDWPTIRAGLETWLAPENFDERGRQRQRLGAILAAPPT